MTNQYEPVKNWLQLPLFPPAVIELTFRVGIAAETDTLQVQIESRDPATSMLLAMVSWPERSVHDLDEVIRRAGLEFTELLREACSPFA